jgi:hypothetical protein
LLGTPRFLFSSNDYFLRLYLAYKNDAAEYCPEKSFQHDAAQDSAHSQPLIHETLLSNSTRRALLHLNNRQRKTQPQFVFQVNLDMMHAVLLKLHSAKIMDVGSVAFHLFEHKLDLRLRDYLLFVHSNEARFLAKFA